MRKYFRIRTRRDIARDFSRHKTKNMPLERVVLPLARPNRIAADFGAVYAAIAFVAFLFACTGPVAIILSVGARGGLSESDIASWNSVDFLLNSFISFEFFEDYLKP